MGMARPCGLDVRVRSPYLAGMANRLLLTLLALLTGLAAQGSPAQARGCAANRAEIGVCVQLSVVQEQRVSAAQESLSGSVLAHDDTAFPAMALPQAAAQAPAVRIGVDRARE